MARAIPRLPLNLRVCHVRQEVAADGRTCMQTVLDSDEHLKALLARKAELEVSNNQTETACSLILSLAVLCVRAWVCVCVRGCVCACGCVRVRVMRVAAHL